MLLKKNNKGVSQVISMIIIIGITMTSLIVAWYFISSIVNKQTETSKCLDTFEKVSINNYYTCNNLSSNETRISIEIKDVDIDSVLIDVYGESNLKTFEVPSGDYDYVKHFGGDYNEELILPSKNSAKTYIFDINKAEIGIPSMIKISPKISGQQCGISDTLSNIDSCSIDY